MTEAFVTLATNDEYAVGALVLAKSLRKVETVKTLAVLITEHVTTSMKESLSQEFDHLELVTLLDSQDMLNLELLARPNLGVTFTKLHCWRLTQYSKCVFMDADTLVIQNVDDLFLREEFSAAPDPGWPDCFNSGVFVYKPSFEMYKSLITFAVKHGSFDGGDQGLLNQYFNDWKTKSIAKHLPFTYNCVSQAFYSYRPAAKFFRNDIKVIHFIGSVKPWHYEIDKSGKPIPNERTGFSDEFVQQWWTIFHAEVKESLPKEELGITSEFSKIGFAPSTYTGPQSDAERLCDMYPLDRSRQSAWERGEIDYEGDDKFDNILNKINSEMNSASSSRQQPSKQLDEPSKELEKLSSDE